jgi:beta-glucuronidase
MSRIWQRHRLREVIDLAGLWDFAFLGEVDFDAVDPAAIVFDDVFCVPGCFDASPAYAGQRGVAAYRLRLPCEPGRHRLAMDSAQHVCRAFVDGREIGLHAGGFTSFSMDFLAEREEPELVVLVDNRLDGPHETCLRGYYDWYHYGGLAGGVELHRLGPVTIDAVRFSTGDLDRRKVSVEIDWRAWPASPGECELEIRLGGATAVSELVNFKGEGGWLRREFSAPGLEPWSPDAPNLHELSVSLGGDDLSQPVGLRTIEIVGRELRLNGEPLRLRGVNRHALHVDFGCALPEAVVVADLQRLRALGCNFVRGSHYPQSPRFLELCDRLGLCVWSEVTGWQNTPEQLGDPAFLAAQIRCAEEMVAAARNHPSVILYGILNEGESHKSESRPAYERILERLRELDSSRPRTFASNHTLDDAFGELADVVSINRYPGWYHGPIETVGEELDRLLDHLEETGLGDRPVIVSEIGGGSIYGWRDAHEGPWSEGYHARLMETILREIDARSERICGLALWQFGDIRTSEDRLTQLRRPRGLNNKGLYDEYRRPKLACDLVRRHLRGE